MLTTTPRRRSSIQTNTSSTPRPSAISDEAQNTTSSHLLPSHDTQPAHNFQGVRRATPRPSTINDHHGAQDTNSPVDPAENSPEEPSRLRHSPKESLQKLALKRADSTVNFDSSRTTANSSRLSPSSNTQPADNPQRDTETPAAIIMPPDEPTAASTDTWTKLAMSGEILGVASDAYFLASFFAYALSVFSAKDDNESRIAEYVVGGIIASLSAIGSAYAHKKLNERAQSSEHDAPDATPTELKWSQIAALSGNNFARALDIATGPMLVIKILILKSIVSISKLPLLMINLGAIIYGLLCGFADTRACQRAIKKTDTEHHGADTWTRFALLGEATSTLSDAYWLAWYLDLACGNGADFGGLSRYGISFGASFAALFGIGSAYCHNILNASEKAPTETQDNQQSIQQAPPNETAPLIPSANTPKPNLHLFQIAALILNLCARALDIATGPVNIVRVESKDEMTKSAFLILASSMLIYGVLCGIADTRACKNAMERKRGAFFIPTTKEEKKRPSIIHSRRPSNAII